jgi:hypothetical protein
MNLHVIREDGRLSRKEGEIEVAVFPRKGRKRPSQRSGSSRSPGSVLQTGLGITG